MKTLILALTILCAACMTISHATEFNFVRNGDFSKGKSGWDGDGSIQEIEGHEGGKALRIKLSRSDHKYITTNLEKTSGFNRLKIKFKAKVSEDFERTKGFEKLDSCGQIHQLIPDGYAFTVELKGSGYFVYQPFKIKELNEWQELTASFINTAKGDADLRFNFFVPPGRGEIYFDDLIICPEED